LPPQSVVWIERDRGTFPWCDHVPSGEPLPHKVLFLDCVGFKRLQAGTARHGRETIPVACGSTWVSGGVTDFTYTGVNPGIPVGNAPSILDRDYVITANITVPSGGAEGVIATLGGRFGGYALMLSPSASWVLSSKPFKYIEWGLLILGILLLIVGSAGRWRKRLGYALLLIALLGLLLSFATDLFHIGRGRPVFVYNFLDLERFRWRGLSSLDEGKHTIVFDFKYAGPGPAKGGTGVLYVDGKEVDRKTIEHTIPLLMSIDETFDIGLDTRTPVDFTYEVPFAFTGTIDKLNYKLGPSQLSAEDQRKMDDAMARVNN